MTDKRFIQILWLYVALTIAAIVAAFFPSYSAALASAYENEPEGWLGLWPSFLLAMVLLVGFVTGLIGLFRLKPWGRTLSMYSTLLGLLLSLVSGPSLSAGIETALVEASTVLWGAILALAYYSPVSQRFTSIDEGSEP